MILKESQKRNPTKIKKKNNGLGKFRPKTDDEEFEVDDYDPRMLVN